MLAEVLVPAGVELINRHEIFLDHREIERQFAIGDFARPGARVDRAPEAGSARAVIGNGTLLLEGNPATLDTLVTLINGSVVPQGFSPPEVFNIESGGTIAGSGFVSDQEGFNTIPAPFTLNNFGTIDADLIGQTLAVDTLNLTNEAGGTLVAHFGATLTVGSDVTYNYNGGSPYYTSNPWVNDGAIAGIGATIELNGSFTSAGTVTAVDGTLDLGNYQPSYAASWKNTGTIAATDTAIVLNENMTTAGIGTIERSGGTLTLSFNGVIDNTGATIDTTAGTFAGFQIDGTIEGGTIVAGPGPGLSAEQGTLRSVAIEGGLTLDSTAGGSLTLSGIDPVENAAGTAIAPTTVFADTALYLYENSAIAASLSPSALPAGDQTLVETSGITLAGGELGVAQPNSPTAAPPAVLTIDAGVTVAGFGSIGDVTGNGAGEVRNAGTIDADIDGQTLTVAPNRFGAALAFVNDGALTAENGATLQIGSDNGNGSVALQAAGTIHERRHRRIRPFQLCRRHAP